MKLKVTVNGTAYDIDVEVEEDRPTTLAPIILGGGTAAPTAPTTASVTGNVANAITAPLAGSVFKILVEPGQAVKAGETVIVLEAMKMETEINAPRDGVVKEILVGVSDPVQGGQPLVSMED